MGNCVHFFKDLFSFWATVLIIELSKGGYITFIKFKCGSHSPLSGWVFEKTNIGCVYLHFGEFNFRAKLYLYFITTGANRLHKCHSSEILNMNLFFSLPMALHITCKYLGYTTMLPFWGYQPIGVFLFLFFLFFSPKYMQMQKMTCSIAEVNWPQNQKCL